MVKIYAPAFLIVFILGLLLAGCGSPTMAGTDTPIPATPTAVPTATVPAPPSLEDLLLGRWVRYLDPPPQEATSYKTATYLEFLDGIVIDSWEYNDGRSFSDSGEYQVLDENRVRIVTALGASIWEAHVSADGNTLTITLPSKSELEYERVP